MMVLKKHFNAIDYFDNGVQNQKLFLNFDTLNDYYAYSLHIQGPK